MKNLLATISLSISVCISNNVESTIPNDSEAINANQISSQCLSKEWNKTKLIELKTRDFVIEAEQSRNQLALQLLNCLASSDPELRDGVAFEALSLWLRGGKITQATLLTMFAQLEAALANPVSDSHGVYQPFAALVMSEVVRVDRKQPYLNDQQRQQIVNIATAYLRELRDYRGFDETAGWRHGIAHTADLLLQLALNSALDKSQLTLILEALKTQIVAHNNHFYIYGEPGRLAMPLVYVFLREQHTTEEWESWLNAITTSSPLADWSNAYQSQLGLAKLHNTKSFLYSLYALIKASKNKTLVTMIPALEAAITKLN